MPAIEKLSLVLRDADIPHSLNEPLAPHTTFDIGGPAAIFCTPRDAGQLEAALAQAGRLGLPVFVLGKGSNVLFCDEGYEGLVIHLARGREGVRRRGMNLVAPAGTALAELCEAARDEGLSGLEFAYGIPGSVGGAICMNAGAYGGEMRDVLYRATVLDEAQKRRVLDAQELGLRYRGSVLQTRKWVAVEAEFQLEPGDRAAIGARMDDHMERRREKQPLDMPSAGSAFKRPKGAFAGALIDSCGLRGCRRGGAAISEKHCGFIVNMGGASCADVLELADHVARVVKEKTGFVLEKEIRVVHAVRG